MKFTQKFISLFLALIIILPFAAFSAFAEAETITSFKINPYGGSEEASVDTVSWQQKSEGTYYMFLPSNTSLSSLTVWFEASSDVYVGETKLVSGEKTDVFSTAGTYTLKSGSKSYSLVVMCSANIPTMYITTQSGSLDYIHASKENKESAKIKVVEDGNVTVNTTLKQIKGRGNTTWLYSEKKPYNIKFDKKTDLFGMGKAKKWSLLAAAFDTSLIRNSVALSMASDIGLAYTSECQLVDLYINGSYRGNYLVCESVEVGTERVNINNLDDANEAANPGVDIEACSRGGTGEDGSVQLSTVLGSKKWVNIPNDPENITGGYLLEFDFESRYDEEVSGFVTNQGQSVVIKSPEYASKAEVEYISDFVTQAEDALYSETGYNSLGKHYSEYFDMDSLVKMYIFQEFVMNVDAGISSCYFYKAENSDKLVAAPAWDFDSALGKDLVQCGVNISDTTAWWANTNHYSSQIIGAVHQIPAVFAAAYKHEDFRELVSNQWNEVSETLGGSERINQIDALGEANSASALMDAYLWDKFTSSKTQSAKLNEYSLTVDTIKSFVSSRKENLNKGFSSSSAMLYYDSNGGDGCVFNSQMALTGESVSVIGTNISQTVVTAPEGFYFVGWNTEKDGSGISYAVGDKITLNEKTTVLYAQWKEGTGCSCICHSNNSVRKLFYKVALTFWKIFKTNKTCQCGATRHY